MEIISNKKIPLAILKKINLYIPNKINIELSKGFENYSYEIKKNNFQLNLNIITKDFYQEENLNLINFYKNILKYIKKTIDTEFNCIILKLKELQNLKL